MPFPASKTRKKTKIATRTVRKDPLYVEVTDVAGRIVRQRPRPLYVDYKDVELLKRLVNRHWRIVGRRKTGCSAASQHAVSVAIKRARFMGLLPYVGE